MVTRHLFDLDAALGGGHDHGTPDASVQGNAEIDLAVDLSALFDQQLTDRLATDLHAQDVGQQHAQAGNRA